MKKGLTLLLSMFLVIGFLGIVSADYGNTESNSGNSINDSNDDSKDEQPNLISANDDAEDDLENKSEDDSDYDKQIREKERERLKNIEELNKEIREKNRIRTYYENKSECPNNCSCTGSSVKCFLENGTREMTIFAGKSGNIIVQFKNSNMSTNVTLYKSDDGKLIAIFKNESREIILPDKIREKVKERLKQNCSEQCNLTLNEDGEYEVETEKEAKLFGLFSVKEKTKLHLNAENGEVVKENSRWWGFLAKDIKEETNSTAQ